MRRPADPWLLILALVLVACQPGGNDIENVVEQYIRSVQERDSDRFLELNAAAVARLEGTNAEQQASLRAREERLFDQRHRDYLRGRDGGWLEFHADGVVLIRALNLGRGTYYETMSVSYPEAQQAVLVQEVRLSYRSINLAGLPAGTTIYLMGLPPGKIYHPVIGEGVPAVRQLMEKVWVRWELVHSSGRWLVQSVGLDERPPTYYDDTTRF